ncbi:hypothetical protein HPB52_007930 [Rhipicephalus sanguineus]|uniref:Uncharacterized protein n=1 Tax=Rhipicephalus sanguineus TaxID=34632 RepID=A0A9D4PLF5_RHISA|nr:hypothetical protein HPB52_007930 [Rhipicephalus sanguineus]
MQWYVTTTEVGSANKALAICRDGGEGYPGARATCEGSSDVRKEPGLPHQVTEPLRSRGGNEAESALAERCHWASNPCRLLYCGRQVVLWRQDGLAKACRNAVHRPWDKTGLDLAQVR